MYVFGQASTYTVLFDNFDNLTGKRFEFFNNRVSDYTIDFLVGTTVNGELVTSTNLAVTIRPDEHVVVMGIGQGEYIYWIDFTFTS
jgi:hypothetical protein